MLILTQIEAKGNKKALKVYFCFVTLRAEDIDGGRKELQVGWRPTCASQPHLVLSCLLASHPIAIRDSLYQLEFMVYVKARLLRKK
ncbi:MAG: hypothetical protein HY044_04705 [Candidatus Woesebacteria bacterium]|nr:MAG: hypothetical protein HY044_04705 [Candidatus Woesebacteria bacterium]